MSETKKLTGKLGVHNLVFTDDWTESNARKACEIAAELGFDILEVLAFDPYTLDAKMTKKVYQETGIEPRVGLALVPDIDISSTNPAIAKAGEKAVERGLQIASELEAPAISGITYAAFNAYSAPPTTAQRDQVLEAFVRLDNYAGRLGVRLGLEAVNRYETFMVNTLDDAGDIIRQIGAKNLFIHMDTFHMNIEEADLQATIRRNADYLEYAHLADNNRGLLGAGTFDFELLFRTLADVGYQGDFTVETFSPAVLSEDIMGAIKLWRTPWTHSINAARQALTFMRAQIESANAAIQAW